MPWKDDDELFALCRRELFPALVGDVMDSMGLTHQFLPPAFRPLRDDMVVIGRAMTVLEADDTGGEGPGRLAEALNRPFGLMLRALDSLRKDEVYICTGSSPRYALWGELMSTAAKIRGASGAVVDGWSRDTLGILRLDFPVFSHGRYAQDQRARGKVIDFQCRIRIGDVTVDPGTIIFGDLDGILAVPRAREEEAFSRALEKARAEKTVLEAIKSGLPTEKAFEKYGVM